LLRAHRKLPATVGGRVLPATSAGHVCNTERNIETTMDARTDTATEARAQAGALVRQRLRVSLGLSAAMMIIYFTFMALFAFDKPLLGQMLAPGLSLCILLGPLVIVSSFLLCLVYVLWANRVFDPALRDLDR
jgi:uncharacterized membrane protein (DUF485 family)